LRTRRGDQQARSEFLAKLLVESGEKPYLVRSGSGKRTYFFVLIPVSDAEIPGISSAAGSPPTIIVVKDRKFMPLDLKKGSEMGKIGRNLYDPASGKWASNITPIRIN
jgi:hypothetical protein